MTTVEEIKAAINELPPQQFQQIARWIIELDQKLWDEQLERDAKAGRLDALAAEAIAEYEAGLTEVLDPERL
jgi:hypothetical protein